jgi:hypothetical protein
MVTTRSARAFVMMASLLAAGLALAQDCRIGPVAADPIISADVPSAAYGDFNEDGRIDVARTVALRDQVVVSLNRGSLVFEDLAPMPIGATGLALVGASDVNHDGHLDLIFRATAVIAVGFGRGDGTFRPAIVTSLPLLEGVTLVDFDHDGALDAVGVDVFGSHGVYFERANADGTFSLAARGSLDPIHSQAITAVGDFDGDGFVDVAAVDYDQSTRPASIHLVVLWGAAAPPLATFFVDKMPSIDPSSLASADVDGDGTAELLAADSSGTLYSFRLQGRKLATETQPFFDTARGDETALRQAIAVDVDGDGIRDLMFNGGIAWGTGGVPRFTAPAYYALPHTFAIGVVDINGDRRPDVITTSGVVGAFMIPGGTPRDAIPAPRVFAPGPAVSFLRAADVDGDGNTDLILTDTSHRAIRVLLGTGTGAFTNGPLSAAPNSLPFRPWFAVGDFDGDGFADVAMSSNVIAFGTGDGSFGKNSVAFTADDIIATVRMASQPPAVLAAHGKDVVVATVSAGRTVQTQVVATVATQFTTASAVDLDGDGQSEILVGSAAGARIFRWNGSSWTESGLVPHLADASNVAAVDVNGDGRIDLAGGGDQPVILFSDGNGAFVPVLMPVFALLDVDGDGAPDAVSLDRFGDSTVDHLTIRLNDRTGAFTDYAMVWTLSQGVLASVTRLSGDGWNELVIPTYEGVEVVPLGCMPPRLRAAATPPFVPEGSRTRLTVATLPGNPFYAMTVKVIENGVVLTTMSAPAAWTFTWTSPPLAKGTHTFTVVAEGPSQARSETTVTVIAGIARHRAVAH